MASPGSVELTSKEIASLTLDAWKKTVDVQQQFNDIELRIRNLAITLLGAAIAAMGAPAAIPLRAPLLVAALGVIAAFWFMDRHRYHRLLQGAVKEGADLERALNEQGVKVNLGRAISKESPIELLGKAMHSRDKIDVFYLALASAIVMGLGLVFSTAASVATAGLVIIAWVLLWADLKERPAA